MRYNYSQQVYVYNHFSFLHYLLAREQAIELGRELVRRHFVHHVTYEHDFEDTYLFYRFLKHVKTRALNGHLSHACLPRKGMYYGCHIFLMFV